MPQGDLNFEHTAILHALDQDSVQSLIRAGVDQWGLSRDQALNQVKTWVAEKLFRCYEDGESAGDFVDVPAAALSLNFLDARPYIWMEPTERTFERWNGIWAEHDDAAMPAAKRRDSVVLVFDPDFGDRLREFAGVHSVWVCQSPANRETVEVLWAEAGERADQATIFNRADATSAEDAFISILYTVDQHHPTWHRFCVFGCQATDRVRAAVAEYGECVFAETPTGFVVDRIAPRIASR